MITITQDTQALEAWENEGGAYLVTSEQDRTEETRGTTGRGEHERQAIALLAAAP